MTTLRYEKPKSTVISFIANEQLLSASDVQIKVYEQKTDAEQLSDMKSWQSNVWDDNDRQMIE